MIFYNEIHKDFYESKAKGDPYFDAMVYCLGLMGETRIRFSQIYDERTKTINPDVIHEGWQTGGTLKITRMAFNLFTDGEPTARRYKDDDTLIVDEKALQECGRYSVSDIFCCGFAPYFVQAIQIRYPEYMKDWGANRV